MPQDDGTIRIDNAVLLFRNFEGRETMYNVKGNRNFCVALAPENAEQMANIGWNVKQTKPGEEGEPGTFYFQVAVGYKIRPPKIVLISSAGRTHLNEDSVEVLDWADIANADLIARPYHWSMPSGATGIKAYLQTLFVTINEDELERKYALKQD